jgi:hypothetical protein
MFISLPTRVDTFAGFLLFCPCGCKRSASQADFLIPCKLAELSLKTGGGAGVRLSKNSTLFTSTRVR